MSHRKTSVAIGETPFSSGEMIQCLEEFALLYEQRPIKDNSGGQGAAQLFYSWFVAKKLKPPVIIESGVYEGQGTWAFENASPDSQLICLDPYPQYEAGFKSNSALYIHEDFSKVDWSQIDRHNTLCFFDDHQNSVQRIMLLDHLGFKKIMFEDNYPPSQGDCLSLKKVLESDPEDFVIKKDVTAKNYLFQMIETYYEMPPIYDLDKNRWGEEWLSCGMNYPLLEDKNLSFSSTFLEGMDQYTWINYVELKKDATQISLEGER